MRGSVGAVAALLGVLVALSPGLAVHGSPSATAAPTASIPLATDAVAVPNSVAVTPLQGSQLVGLTLGLADPHLGALEHFLSAVENPSSPDYRHFLTHAEFESSYAPSAGTAAGVASELRASGGIDVAIAPDRLSVTAEVPASSVSALFGVSLVSFHPPDGATEYTAVGTPRLPASWNGTVDSIDGLSNAANARVTENLAISPLVRTPIRVGTPAEFALDNATGEQWFVGSDFTNTLDVLGLLPGDSASLPNATYPTGEAIATLLASGYNQTLNVNTPPWDPAVVRGYFNDTLAPAWVNLSQNASLVGVPVTLGGVTPPAPGPFGSVNDSTLDTFENALDLEMAGSLAPGAALYNFYFAGSLLQSSSDSDVAGYFDQDLADALSYNYSSQSLGVVTCSFGISDLNDSTWNQELQEAASMGVTVVAASGDQGNAPDHLTGRSDGQWPVWPATAASNTSGVVSVGGVTISLDGPAAGWFNGSDLYITYDANTTGLNGLSTWWDTLGGPGTYAGSEGGASSVYAEPAWQFHSAAQPAIVNATVLQGASALGRTGPDVAMPANSTVAFVYADGEGNLYFSLLEGTSVAAPAFAGLMADEIAVAHHDFGFIDPELYRIGSYFANHTGSSAFLDVVTGANYVFSAAPGWDATTGWGVPLGTALYAADADPAIRDYVYTGPTPSLPPAAPAAAVPWTEILIVFGVGIAVAVVLVILVARPGAPAGPPPAPPFGATMAAPPPPTYSLAGVRPAPEPVATFLCPYCGAPRPAEPVRCPKCGAL
jgi:subtilase family serine protease